MAWCGSSSTPFFMNLVSSSQIPQDHQSVHGLTFFLYAGPEDPGTNFPPSQLQKIGWIAKSHSETMTYLQSFMSWQIVILYRRKVEAAELGNFETSTEHWVRSGHLDIFILSHALSSCLAWALCCAWLCERSCGYRNENCIVPALEALTVSQNRFTHYHTMSLCLQ